MWGEVKYAFYGWLIGTFAAIVVTGATQPGGGWAFIVGLVFGFAGIHAGRIYGESKKQRKGDWPR